MKTILKPQALRYLVLNLWLAMIAIARADTNFVMTTPNFIYEVNGVPPTNAPGFFVNNCPPLTLFAGHTYTFTMEAAAIHPMIVGTNFSSGTPAPAAFAYSNAAPQDIATGTMVLTLPATDFPTHLYYQCNVHGFYGVITVMPSPVAPPPNEIVSLSVTTNIVLISTGVSTSYVLVPQFNCDLLSGTWLPVPKYSNTFANGTNTTVFDRLDPICGSNVFLRVSQQPPN